MSDRQHEPNVIYLSDDDVDAVVERFLNGSGMGSRMTRDEARALMPAAIDHLNAQDDDGPVYALAEDDDFQRVSYVNRGEDSDEAEIERLVRDHIARSDDATDPPEATSPRLHARDDAAEIRRLADLARERR